MKAKRTLEQLRAHYELEKELALRLKSSSREERKVLYKTLYDELFSKIPDHPRLSRRVDPEVSLKSNKGKFALVKNFISKNTIFGEFAPGDCKFCYYLQDHVKFVYGFDISDQSDLNETKPDNFKLIVYDGYDLEMTGNSIDVLFSDQLIEHIHPDDLELHFTTAQNLLKPGGVYIFRIPHRLSGPYDISRHFSDEPEGFHLNEATYSMIIDHLQKLNFKKIVCYWYSQGIKIKIPKFLFTQIEKAVIKMKPKMRKKISKYLLPNVSVAAIK